jgi:3-deoxy-D-manno-octulosonic acid kinase
LSVVIAQSPVGPDTWQAVGRCIRRFHDAGFYHADLSTHNLQLDARGKVWLLDWDRGRLRSPGRWRQANLQRLHRSCRKIRDQDGARFTTDDWRALLDGYASVASA